jgi:hypothetical protein
MKRGESALRTGLIVSCLALMMCLAAGPGPCGSGRLEDTKPSR